MTEREIDEPTGVIEFEGLSTDPDVFMTWHEIQLHGRAYENETRAHESTPYWLLDIERQVKELTLLSHGWDGFGGSSITTTAAEVAMRILNRQLFATDRLPSVVPLSDGGINLEWHRPELDLEVEITPTGGALVYFSDGVELYEVEDDYHSVESRLGEFISRFN